MKATASFIFVLSLLCWIPWSHAKDETPKVTPLDSATAKVLENSPLSPYASDLNEDQNQFQRLSQAAETKIGPVLSLPQPAARTFVYDCLFMTAPGFEKKYSHLPKEKVQKARALVLEVFKP